jgi:hypothetical protein
MNRDSCRRISKSRSIRKATVLTLIVLWTVCFVMPAFAECPVGFFEDRYLLVPVEKRIRKPIEKIIPLFNRPDGNQVGTAKLLLYSLWEIYTIIPDTYHKAPIQVD